MTWSLAPGVRLLQRTSAEAQLGLQPARALRLPQPLAGTLVKCLANGEDPITKLVALGYRQDDLGKVLHSLRAAGLVRDSDIECRLDESHYSLDLNSGGRLGLSIAQLAAATGFGKVSIRDKRPVGFDDLIPWGASRIDVGVPREVLAQQLLGKLDTRPALASQRISILVCPTVAEWPWLNPRVADWCMSQDVPFVAVALGANHAQVTSVISPGQNGCLQCWHECVVDSDDAWSTVVAQLIEVPELELAPAGLVWAATLESIRQIQKWISDPDCNSQSELVSLDWLAGLRTSQGWPIHPACGCRLKPRSATDDGDRPVPTRVAIGDEPE